MPFKIPTRPVMAFGCLVITRLWIRVLILSVLPGCQAGSPARTAPGYAPPAPAQAKESAKQASVAGASVPIATQPSRAIERPDPDHAATRTAGEMGSRVIQPFPDITVILRDGVPARVEVKAWTCTPEYPLEQVACSPQTREHESLVVVNAKPSQIHAALLMAGCNPGTPGRWTYENKQIGTVAPTGDKIDVLVRYTDAGGKQLEQPIANWIRDIAGKETFPDRPWVFGGSAIVRNNKQMGEGEHYVADMSGSIIGLVTFGDEVLGFSAVISDQADVQAPEWEARTDQMPPAATVVTLVLIKHPS